MQQILAVHQKMVFGHVSIHQVPVAKKPVLQTQDHVVMEQKTAQGQVKELQYVLDPDAVVVVTTTINHPAEERVSIQRVVT